ncbi:MAG: DUF4163 domain-containing protein [Selenomonadaceae bacterium]|nr:DUF4163 domain-containing protein [Selenomonadaceae bacterium]
MRKIFLTLLVALIVGVQNFCGAVTIETANFNGNEKIVYPVVHAADAEIENKINRKIREELVSFIKGNQYAVQYHNQKILDARMNYEVTCNEAGNTVILSIVFTESRYVEGAAHPATWKRALNINTSSGNRMSLDYLTDIGGGNPQFSLENVSRKLREHCEREKIYLFDDALPLKKLPENFYWDENLHVHLIFQHYEVAPYAAGIIDVDMN